MPVFKPLDSPLSEQGPNLIFTVVVLCAPAFKADRFPLRVASFRIDRRAKAGVSPLFKRNIGHMLVISGGILDATIGFFSRLVWILLGFVYRKHLFTSF